jgi:multisubunit Na+/H+ antiporter MnhC subunit
MVENLLFACEGSITIHVLATMGVYIIENKEKIKMKMKMNLIFVLIWYFKQGKHNNNNYG